MKLFLAVVCCIAFTGTSLAQEKVVPNHNLGLSYTQMADKDMVKFQSLDGAPSYHVGKSYIFGLVYFYQFTNKWSFETGLDYGKYTVDIEPAPNPLIDLAPRETSLGLVSIPISMRYNIWEYFFLNAGALIDIQIEDPESVDDQTGIGALLGVGVKYDFKWGTSIFLNPIIKAHALLPFSKERYHDHLLESGLRFGITQKF